jgi:hypothetical protein
MLSNFSKIFIKYSFCFFVFLGVTQEALCMQRTNSEEFDEEGLGHPKKRVKTDDLPPFISVIPLAGTLASVSPEIFFISTGDEFEDRLQSHEERQELLLGNYEMPGKEAASKLRQLGVSEVKAQEVLMLSSALHKEMRTEKGTDIKSTKELDLNYAMISPEKLRAFEELGGDINVFEQNCRVLKLQFVSPIRNPKYPLGAVYSPAARVASISRLQIEQGRLENIIRSLPVDFRIAPTAPETPEEREERKKQQLIDFLEMEKVRGKISEEEISKILEQKGAQKWKEASAEIKREIELWQDHLNYIDMRKKQLLMGDSELLDEDEFQDDGSLENDDSFLCSVLEVGEGAEVDILDAQQKEKKVRKIRKAEIEDSFENFVAGKLICLKVEGYDLWFSKGIDLDRTDEDGDTNLERMNSGLCPIGADGETMNFHHLTHYDFKTHKIKSIIVPLTEYVHRIYSGKLHFGRNTYQDLPRTKVNRNEWNKVRFQFNKSIAEYFSSLPK